MRLSHILLVVTSAVAVPAWSLAQNAPARLGGTWVMDSTNGPDDHGLPKSETLKLTPTPHGLRITATEDDGQGPDTSNFDCTSVGGITNSGTSTLECTILPTRDSVRYAVDVRQQGKLVATERGWLVLSADGRVLRDEYDASDGTHSATHHRHIYTKHS